MSRMVLLTTIILTLSIGVGAIFVPDHILRISVGTTQQDCQPRISTLINGSYPAPPIYLDPDVTTWIRVYNDADVNATIVSHLRRLIFMFPWLTCIALARPVTCFGTLRRRRPAGVTMAHPPRPIFRL